MLYGHIESIEDRVDHLSDCASNRRSQAVFSASYRSRFIRLTRNWRICRVHPASIR